jgi:hypothetical protein
MHAKQFFCILSAIFMTMMFSGCASGGTTKIKLDKKEYAPTETVSITYSISETLKNKAWIGVIPSGAAHGKEVDGDAVDISYQYLNGEQTGETEFMAPAVGGKYDVRIYDTDDNGIELGSTTFEVIAPPVDEEKSTAVITLEKDTYSPGESLEVTFDLGDSTVDSTAWIALVSAEVVHGNEAINDANQIAYQYLDDQKTGTLSFTAPETPGAYDVRLMSSDSSTLGVELSSKTFNVVESVE